MKKLHPWLASEPKRKYVPAVATDIRKTISGGIARLSLTATNKMVFSSPDFGTVGVLDFNDPKMKFTGDADESAKIFLDYLTKSFSKYLEPLKAQQILIQLIEDTMREHRDPDSAFYNRCEIDTCKWCTDAAQAIRNASLCEIR